MTTTPDSSEATAVADAYFGVWQANEPTALAGVLAPDLIVHGPLGRIDGAEQYQVSLGRIFALIDTLEVRKRWVDGDDVMTWFDLMPHGAAEPWAVASRLHIEDGRITGVRVTFDLGRLLKAGAPRTRTTA